MLDVDANGPFTCPIWTCIHVVMSVQTFAILRMSQPLLVPLKILPISNSSRGYVLLTLCIPPCSWLAPLTLDHIVHRRGTNHPTLISGFTPWSVTNSQMWKSNLILIIALPEQHYNNPNHTRQLWPHIGPMHMEAVSFGLGWVRPHHLTHISL